MDPQTPETPETPSPLLPALRPTERRNGKVARLPKATRDKINVMIQDGAPYLQIIERLGPEGEGLNENNLSRWKAGGYLDWLRELQLTDALQAKHELALAIVSQAPQANNAGQAVLQIIATNLCEFLIETDPATLRDSLLSDADKFTRFVNAMVRLAEGGIKCDVHKQNVADRLTQTAKERSRATSPGISPESLQIAEEKLKLL